VPPQEAVEDLQKGLHRLWEMPGVTAVAPVQLEIAVAAFGNLLMPDCHRLASRLRSAFEGADGPVIRFAGVSVAESGAIEVGLAGELEPLADLARFVSEASEKLRLFVDRRRFRPHLRVAAVEPGAPADRLRSEIGPLVSWSGAPWRVRGLSLLGTRWHGGEGTPELFDLISLA
jgi:2'-5' RNA ligase